MHLLYVEDDRDTSEAMQRYLQKKVAKLYVTDNGEYGVELFKSKKIDIIVTDIKMPHKDGIAMVQEIKRIKKEVKVIFVSAYHEEELFLKAIGVGADGFLIKPVSVANGLLPLLQKAAAQVFKERLLNEYTKTLKLILDYVDTMVAVTDGKRLYNANKPFLNRFDVASVQDFNRKFASFDAIAPQKKLQTFFQSQAKEPLKLQIAGCTYFIQAKPIDAKEGIHKYVVNFTDITELEQEKKFLLENAAKDSVTQLINIDAFSKIFTRELRQSKTPLALATVSILNLESINLKHSYENGDAVLKSVADMIVQVFDETKSICRWVGGKFLVLTSVEAEEVLRNNLVFLQKRVVNFNYGFESKLECKTAYKRVDKNSDLHTLLEGLK
jgi:PleD family two-component response regulator